MHVRRNGSFFSVAAFVEQVDKRLLRREQGVDDDGALYKMFNKFTSGTSGVEKKNREFEGNADLTAFVNAINGSSGAALENVIFDQVDIPRQLNYLAAGVLCQNDDNSTKNYYLYRDSEGTGEWFQIAWDLDLTWGSHYMTGDTCSPPTWRATRAVTRPRRPARHCCLRRRWAASRLTSAASIPTRRPGRRQRSSLIVRG